MGTDKYNEVLPLRYVWKQIIQGGLDLTNCLNEKLADCCANFH